MLKLKLVVLKGLQFHLGHIKSCNNHGEGLPKGSETA
jgi:hypothetical protein